jgi:hypothetical protein
MTRLPFAMRHYDGDETTVAMMVGAVAASLIEQDKAFLTQERSQLPKADVLGRVAHPINELLTATHIPSPYLDWSACCHGIGFFS